ncbi:MAG TPA: protein kinase, partial [Polyangiaceae bacterium]|nr:protein kinase [Polyangiaceae bacterium]
MSATVKKLERAEVVKRYDLVRTLGSGGNATVDEVIDRVTGRSLALKRLRAESAMKPSAALLFRREYRTLRDLAHPLIIRAYDYGVEEGVPYYTMELASGSDLRSAISMPWREACAVLRDVASALALVHSRRLVHRDVTPANVLRTADGRAKLLDFGSLCPMGVAGDVVGTAPFVSPEALDGRPLDGRTDLFALGALGYFLLTNKHAYPAARLSELERVWRHSPEPPGQLAREVPAPLDDLIVSLLSLNAQSRPSSAAEVLERLAGVAGFPPDESRSVALSYLVAPTLVGRDGVVARFRRRILRADRGRGSALIIDGKAGVGRSRLLNSLLIDAKLLGMSTLYASGAEGRKGPFGVARVLVKRLLEVDPERAREALPDPTILEQLGPSEDEDAEEVLPADFRTLVDGVSEWLVRASAVSPLLVAVDDIDDGDVPSAAIIARLAEAAPSRRLLVVATVRSGGSGVATERLRSMGSSHALRPLRASETKHLLSSVFGEVPHLQTVSMWLHALSEGYPQTLLELAQHLVDRQIFRYESGAWTLPASTTSLDVPRSFDGSTAERIAALNSSARSLAEGLSLTVVGEPFHLDDYSIFLGSTDADGLFAALNDLVAASILVGSGGSYAFVHEKMRRTLAAAVPDDRKRQIHSQLAELNRAAANGGGAIVAHHLLLAGEERAAFAALVDFISHRSEYFVRGYRLLRSKDGASLFQRLFEWGRRESAPKTDLVLIGRALLGLASVAFADQAEHAPWLVAELERDTGLAHWDEFENTSDPAERIRACIRRAIDRANALPEAERGLPPTAAIREFSGVATMLAGLYAQANEPERAMAILAQLNKLRSLSPGIDLAADVVQYAANARRGWIAADFRLRVLARSSTTVPGLDDTIRFNINILATFYQGIEEAMMGAPTFAERAGSLESSLPFSALAWHVRMLGHLFRGEEKQADACRRKRDAALVGQAEAEVQIASSVGYELVAYVILGDLMAIKRTLPVLRARAASMPAWTPHLLLAEGTHAYLRGDVSAALELYQRALDLAPAGAHSAYALIVARVTSLLIELGRSQEALERAEQACATCSGLPILPAFHDLLEVTRASAEASVGKGEEATQRVRDAVARAEGRGTAGIIMMALLATQARVAVRLNDEDGFASASRRVAELGEKVDSRSFAAGLSSLFRTVLGAGFEPVDSLHSRLRS